MSLIYLDNDPWITEHGACEKLYRDIMSQLALRGNEQRTSHEFARLSANIRLRLKQYSSEVEQLNQKLDQATRQQFITMEESERRSRQIELLKSREIQMQQQFSKQLADNTATAKHALLGGQSSSSSTFVDMGTANWGTGDDDELIQSDPTYNHQSVQQLKEQRTRMLAEQEQGLEALSKIISRQKDIANTIGDEVDLHNEILDDLADHIERTDDRVNSQTRNIVVINRKDSTCGYWIVIILLFISIMVVALV